MLKQTRTRFTLTLLGALMLSSLVFAAGVGAQRPGAQRQANQNERGGQQKRVFVGRGSESKQGSRVTITADDTLKDYSAYRSGDRFYVVLPKSAAARAGGGSGRGYSDMQVQQRGDSVVLSYRVQPGAKPRVEQKFNRLDVVFDVPEGAGQQAAAPNDAGRAQQQQQQQQQQQAEARGQTPAGQQQSQPVAPSSNNAAERNAALAAEAARAQAANAAQAHSAPPPVLTADPSQPAPAADPNAQPGSAPATAQEGASPAPTADANQLAQAQPPAAPVQITKPAEGAQASPTGSTLGAFLMRNWALTLIIALVVVGLGLVIAARRTSPAPAGGSEEEGAKPKLGESHAESGATRARESSAAALGAATANAAAAVRTSKPEAAKVSAEVPTTVSAETTPEVAQEATPELSADVSAEVTPDVTPEVSAVDAKPLVAATALAGGAAVTKSRKQSRKDARRKKKGGPADNREAVAGSVETPADADATVEEATVETPTVESPAVEASHAVAEVRETTVEETLVTESVVERPLVEQPVEEQFVDETASEETLAAAPVVEETAADVEAAPSFEVAESPEVSASEPTIGTTEPTPAEAEAAFVVSEAATALEPVAPAAEESAPSVAEAVEQSTGIEPAIAPDLERVSAETRQLLEGAGYDRAVIGTRDPFARQMIAAELLSALAGRNPQRRERASAAFVEQGYFDETARDLRGADAPAERAAAARSLALLGDRAATPHLIAALEDASIDVRRAAVEALGSLRDPSAVAPLEALMERERNERNRIPPRVIRVAADSCRDAAVELAAELAAAKSAPAIESAPSVEVERGVEPATAETERLTETAIEPAVGAEPVPAFQSVAPEPSEETSVSITPFVEEARAEAEEIPAAEAQTLAAEAEAFVAHEEPSLTSEVGVEAAEPRAFAPGVSEAVETAAAESHSLETAVAEPQAVVETGIRPFTDAEESALEVSEPEAEVTTDAAAAMHAEEVALKPFVGHAAEESDAHGGDWSINGAESAQAEPFGGRADEEATREIAPFREDAAPVGADADEWFDLDVNEMRGEPQPAAEPAKTAEPAAEYETHLFESSSGEAFAPQAARDATAAEGAATYEPPPSADARAEVTRELDPAAAFEPAREESAPSAVSETAWPPAAPHAHAEKGIALFDEHSTVPASIQQRLASGEASERAAAIGDLSRVDTDEAFQQICAGFDDESKDVRNAAARALYELRPDRAESFTRALREASPERRREIGVSISTSGLAVESISQLTGESREKTYEAFSLLFLMAKAGEVAPLIRAIEGHPSNEVRLAVVKLLALSGQKEILPAFRRLAVRGSLPTEVRSAVMEAIYQISSSQPTPA